MPSDPSKSESLSESVSASSPYPAILVRNFLLDQDKHYSMMVLLDSLTIYYRVSIRHVDIDDLHAFLRHRTYYSNRLVAHYLLHLMLVVVLQYPVVYNKVSIVQLMSINNYSDRIDSLRVNQCILN